MVQLSETHQMQTYGDVTGWHSVSVRQETTGYRLRAAIVAALASAVLRSTHVFFGAEVASGTKALDDDLDPFSRSGGNLFVHH